MKIQSLILSSFAALVLFSPAAGEIAFPAPSPVVKVTQNVGLTEVGLEYSRPGVKGRKIFGELLPYGSLWRTGANASTKLVLADDVMIEGVSVPAGTYSVLSIPGESEWTVILNKNVELRGTTGYEESDDQARFIVESQKLNDKVESLTIGLNDLRDDSATLVLDWENTRVPLKMTLDTKSKVLSQIKAQMFDGSEKTAGEYGNASYYYYQNDQDLEQALEWMQKAIELKPDAFYYYHRNALILAKLGRKKEAIDMANRSIEVVQAVPAMTEEWTFRNQELIDSLK